SAGAYYVNVTVKDSLGNSASTSFKETVYSDPSVTITSSQNPTDIGNSVTFTASPSGGSGVYTYQWYLNGDAISGATSSTYTTSFNSAGTDSIYVLIHDTVGNSAQSPTLTQTVNADPSVSISSSQNPTDVGNSVTFTASPSGGSGSYTYQWYLGGSAVSGATSSTYTTSFSSAGTESVYVIIKDSLGDSATSSTLTETVNADPSVTITSSQNPTDVGNSVTFTASGSAGTGSYSYQWYYGNNNTAISGATDSEYTTSFKASGSYEFYVVLTDTNGNTAKSTTLTEKVDSDPSVTVSESPSPTDAGVPVTFDSSASGGTGSYNYTWTINGKNYYSQDVTVTFSSSGTYTAEITVRDSIGDTASSSETIVVNNDPYVSINVEYSTVYSKTNDTLTASGNYGTSSYNYTWYNGTTVIGYGHSIVYKWNAKGNYTISVTLKDSLSVTASSSVTIQVVPHPDIFIAGPLKVTVGQSNTWSMVESHVTINGAVSWYNDGTSADDSTPFFTFTYPTANVNVTIEVSYDVQGKYYNNTITVHVYAKPEASISVSHLTIDAGVSDSVTAVTKYGTPGFTYSWTIDNQVFNSQDVYYQFSNPGTYIIKLTATDGDGVSASAETNISVINDPSVTVSSSASQYDAGYDITFTATGSGGSGSYSYQWYVNGIAVSGATSSTYTTSFSSSGTDSVYATISDSYLTESSNVLKVSIVNDPSVKITASRTTIDAGQSISFSAGVSNGTSPYTYSWTINAGASVSSSSSFSYVFSTAGSYTVEISVTDADGYSAIYKVTITVSSDLSVSPSVSDSQIDQGATETFTATPSGGYGTVSYQWILDNNVISTSSSFTYVFNSIGSRTIEVKATDSNGFTAYSNVTVDVVSQPSIIYTAKYTSLDAGVQDIFTSSVDYGTAPFTYSWTINGISEGSGSTLDYTFTTSGTYTVNVTVTDTFGFKSTYSERINVVNDPSVKIFSSTTTTDAGKSISFLSEINGGTSPYNYTWSINGAAFSYNKDASYLFTASGAYTIRLVITDSFGISANYSVVITVNAKPSVTFVASHNTIDSGQSISFTPSITGGTSPYTYEWYVNDVLVSSNSVFTYVFSTAGTYTIRLVITDSFGLNASYSLSVTVNPPLTGKISVSYPNLDLNITETITLTAENGTSPYTYSILINGVRVSTASSYSKYFTTPGTYLIVAYVNDTAGESIKLSTSIDVRANPMVSITTPTNETDANVPIHFRGILSGGTGPYSYSWLVAGMTYSNATFTHAFTSAGTYSVQLTVTDSFGREAIASISITVLPDPHATLITPKRLTASVSEPLGLNITGGIKPYTAQWYFSSGEQLTGINISHAFSSAGPETFQVQVRDSSGFTDIQNFTVNVGLYVRIAANQTSGLGPLVVQFSSSVLGGSDYSYNWTFSPGHYSLEQNPLYTFPAGNYTVHFSVTSANGATGSANISIESLPPPVTFEYSTDLNITQAFHFKALPNWGAAGPYNMSWSFPNGQTITGMNISYRFPVYNELNTVIATFTYDGGKTWTQYLTVRMVPAIPSVSLSLPKEIPSGTMLSLNATASSPDSESFSYSWDINGTVYTGDPVLYYFGHPGNYSISLTVTDSLGASRTVSAYITVLTPGTNKTIAISYTKSEAGPMVYYTIHVQSLDGISAVEAFIGSSILNIVLMNETYSSSGSSAYYNLTLDQRDYNAGTYSIEIVVFNNDSASNSISMPFSVTSQYSANVFTFATIIDFFGGITNFIITALTFAGVLIAYLSLRRQDNPDVIVEGMNARGKDEKIVLKGKK
ncbi:PKD domain-containing protein, partial [Caldiplasma sukawensis]